MDMRKQFESWVKSSDLFKWEPVSLDVDEDGYYVDDEAGVQRMWLAWQAAVSSTDKTNTEQAIGVFLFEKKTSNGTREFIGYLCDDTVAPQSGSSIYTNPVTEIKGKKGSPTKEMREAFHDLEERCIGATPDTPEA